MKNAVRSLVVAGLTAIAACSSANAAGCTYQYMTPGNVTTQVNGVSDGYLYSYTVGAISTCGFDITSFSTPYSLSLDISDITSPTGWSYTLSQTDDGGLLTWTAASGYGIHESVPGSYLSGFSFESSYGDVTKVSSTVTDDLGTYLTGGYTLVPTIPEPSNLLLCAIGLGALLLRPSRLRRNTAA